MAANNLPEAGYDKAKPKEEGAGDAATIRTIYDRDGADAAATRLREEVDRATASGASQTDLDLYRQNLLKGLSGDGTTSNILPELAIGFGMQNKDKIMSGRLGIGADMVDDAKLRAARDGETNPIYREMYNQFDKRYRELQTENAQRGIFEDFSTKLDPGNPVWARQLDGILKAGAERARSNTENRNDLGVLATHPTLFKDIASGDGRITRDEALAFQQKWNQGYPDGDAFRAKYATTPGQRTAVETAVNKLVESFDQEKNKDNKPGSVLKDNNKGAIYGMNYGSMTEQSLAEGMGYRNIAEAKARVPRDTASVNPGVTPIPEVKPVTDYSSTAQNRGDGPWQVANRMLTGDRTQDQSKFFKNPAEAQRMLTEVMGNKDVWKFDQQGKPHVTSENRDDILTRIQAAEAKKAADSGQPVNSDLSNWFASRYPKDLPTPAAVAAASLDGVQPDTDRKKATIARNDGPERIATRMAEGLNEAQRRILQAAIVPGKYDDRAGVMTDRSIESIRAALDAMKPSNRMTEADIAYVKAWYAKRYAPKA